MADKKGQPLRQIQEDGNKILSIDAVEGTLYTRRGNTYTSWVGSTEKDEWFPVDAKVRDNIFI